MHKESPLNFEKKKELGFSFLLFLQFFLFLAFKKNSAAKERTASRRNSLSLSLYLSPAVSLLWDLYFIQLIH
jgi:hypothetical protein